MEKNTTDLTIQPVPFSSPLLPLQEDALAQLRKVSILLKTYPLEKIVLVGYAIDPEEDPLPVSNVLEKAVAFLLTEGTRLSQVKWLAAPAKFSPQKNGLRAIEIFAVNPEILPPPIQIIQTAGTSFEAKFFKKSLGSLVYQVQVPLGESTHADELLRFFPDGIMCKQAATDQTWFSLGYQLSWAAAVEAEKSARKIGFAQAVAVPVLNGWELSKESASKHLHEYPELAFFIERE